jgi:hypothetical protein
MFGGRGPSGGGWRTSQPYLAEAGRLGPMTGRRPILRQTTVNNRQRRAAPFSYDKRLQESVADFLVCWFMKVIRPQGVPSGNADWKVRNTLWKLL